MTVSDGRKAQLVIIAAALCLIGLYVFTLIATTGGRPVSPLDDAYIHFQYARQIALGEPWRYNSGDPISTGATSFLYPFLLAAGYAAGFQSDQIVWVALLIGSLSLIASALLIYHITWALLRSGAQTDKNLRQITAVAAALLFLLNGAVPWAYFNGMESGIFTLFVLAALYSAIEERYWNMAIFLILASFLRPEGLFLAGVAWIVIVGWQFFTNRPQLRRVFWPMSTAVLLSATPYFANLILTGTPIATGAQAKSWLGNVPFLLADIIRSVAHMVRHITLRISMGFLAPKPWPVVPFMLPIALVGAVGVWRSGYRRDVLLVSGWVFTGTLATATLITALWQVGRYQVPSLVVMLPLSAAGIYTLMSMIKEPLRRSAAVITFLFLLSIALVTTYQAQRSYHFALDSLIVQQISLGDWIREHLAEDVRIAVHDAGVIRYVGERPIHDLLGLSTQGAAVAWRHGSGAQFELMEQLDKRPEYFATYPDVQAIPYFAETDMFTEQLFVTENYPRRTAGKAGDLQAIYKSDWRLANSGDNLQQANLLQFTDGLMLVAAIDVADIEAEKAKDLTWSNEAILSGFATEVRQLRYRTDEQKEVIDGGRLITGNATFPVVAEQGQSLTLTARLHPVAEGAVRVWVDGQDAGLWRYPAAPGQWIETAFVVPADLVRQDNPVITLQVQGDEKLEHAYPLFYIWVWQGEPQGTTVAPQHEESFEFGDGLMLLGYDLDLTQAAARKAIPLTLYWHAQSPKTVDAKLFVHLYDEEGNLIAQIDQRPYFDTQPPFAWIPGIPVVDSIQFNLPVDLAPGSYTLVIGLYDPVSGGRFSVSGNADRILPDNRVALGEFTFP